MVQPRGRDHVQQLENTYGVIAEWCEDSQSFEPKGRQFCGLLMGDHSKTAIHTAFSTATVVGVMANVFGEQTPPRHVPNFQWGVDGDARIDLDKGLDVARKVMRVASRPCPRARSMPFGHSFRNKSAKVQQVGWHV